MRKLGENGTFYADLEEKKVDLKGQRFGKNKTKKLGGSHGIELLKLIEI